MGGNDDRQADPIEDDGDSDKDNDGTASLVYVSTAAVTMTTVVVACVIVAWRKRIAVRTTAETAIAANLIAPDRAAAHDDEKSNANYAHLLPQERIQRKPIYPNLNAAVDPDDGCDTVRRPDSDPDIMVRHNYGKLQCLISIADRGIPGPESCV